MNKERDIALIDELTSYTAENHIVEFKHNNVNHDTVGKLCSALANAARIDNKELAYIVWGVDDGTHEIKGTDFDPEKHKIGNEIFQFWLAKSLKPSIAFNFRIINHPLGRVVLLEIPAATSAPVEFNSIAYVRISSATPKLSDYPERLQKLLENIRPFSWEKGLAKTYVSEDEVLSLLDYPGYFQLTKQPLPDNRKGILERLEADGLISKDIASRWNITNLGAILFAQDLNLFDQSIARKAVRFIAYDGVNKAATVTHRQDGRKGYAVGFEGLVNYINGLLPVNEHIGRAFRETEPLFPEIAIRELIANALIHQDMTITGAGPQVELFKDRIEITNPGSPLVQTDRMIDLPPRSRNDLLASLMRRVGLCEEQGSGLDKVIVSIEVYQLPPPKFSSDSDATQVVVYGPRKFSEMTPAERVRACYQHSVIQYLSGGRMKNASLCKRFGIPSRNAAQVSKVITMALEQGRIKVADDDHPRAGYVPFWA